MESEGKRCKAPHNYVVSPMYGNQICMYLCGECLQAKKRKLGESPKDFQVLKVESGVNESAAWVGGNPRSLIGIDLLGLSLIGRVAERDDPFAVVFSEAWWAGNKIARRRDDGEEQMAGSCQEEHVPAHSR